MGKRKVFGFVALGAALVFVGVLYVWGRSLWYPYYVKLQGGRTVAEVVDAARERRAEAVLETSWDRLVLIGVKEERVLEVWALSEGESPRKIREYSFTGYSGKLGPKLREGDRQIPEGIYRVEYLNPNSSFYLSMKLDYPNEFDRKKGRADGRDRLGYDIFIHGKSATIGCIPIGDEGIEDLFILVAEAGVENVEVILSPYDMREGTRTLAVEEIDWEEELYSQVGGAMAGFVERE